MHYVPRIIKKIYSLFKELETRIRKYKAEVAERRKQREGKAGSNGSNGSAKQSDVSQGPRKLQYQRMWAGLPKSVKAQNEPHKEAAIPNHPKTHKIVLDMGHRGKITK